jgi:hypothetical protein
MTKTSVHFFCTVSIPLLLLSSCADRLGRPKQTVNGESAVVVNKQLSPALNEYQAYINSQKPADITTVNRAVEKYHSSFSGKDAATCDTAFTIFCIYQKKVGSAINVVFNNDTADYTALFTSDGPGHSRSISISPALQAFNEQLHQQGFVIAEEEGAPFIAVEGDTLKSWFYSYISPTLKDYLDQVNKEAKEPFSSDAAMSLDPKAYVDRIVWWERFIQQHPGFFYENEAKENKQLMLTCLLLGMDNTPLTANEGELQAYYKTAYNYLGATYPETETNKIVEPYSKAAKIKDYVRQKALLNQYKQKGYIKDFGG